MSVPWSGLFVTGTDTEVGKSVTTACLAAALRGSGKVRALKPVASGVEPGAAGEDATLLARAAGHPVPEGSVRLRTPCSPHRAAVEEGVRIELEDTLAWVRANAEPDGVTLVEGVGGWEVPIGADWGVSDLATELGWPVLVVAADRLGCLNHTLLTVRAIRQRGLEVVGVVLTRSDGGWNHQDLVHLLPGVPIVQVGTLSSLDDDTLRKTGRGILEGVARPISETARRRTVGTPELEEVVALLTVGLLVALQRAMMTAAEAQHILFSPATLALLKQHGARASVVDLIHAATEIEDIEGLGPSVMAATLERLVEDALECVVTGELHDFNADKWLSKLRL